MATHELLSPAQRLRLTQLADPMDERVMARYHTLSDGDLRVIGKRRRPETRMGFSVQLCYLRFPGRPFRSGERPPSNLLEYVAAQLGLDPVVFSSYARQRDTTRRKHLAEIVRAFGFRPFDAEARRDLFGFLLPVAMGTDRGTALVEAALTEMRARAIVAPAIATVEDLCWEARREARQSVLRRLTEDLSPEVRARLDGLLVVSPGEARAPLIWLREPPSAPGPKNFHKIVDRLEFVRSLGLPSDAGGGNLRDIHNNRLAQLAREGAKTTPQHLRRFDPDHRHATLVAYLTERAATLADEALDMHDRLVGEMLGKDERVRDETFRKRGKAINEKVGLYAAVGKALISARETGEDPYAMIEDAVGWERFVESIGEAEELALPADFDYLEHLEGQYRRLRGYTPALLETFEFSAAPPAEPLLQAVNVLKQMNATGKRKVPEDAPTSFVKPRWERHVFDEAGIDKRYYEMSAVTELKNGLKSGDVWVPGSRKYADFEDYLLTRTAWERMKGNGGPPVAINPDLDGYLAQRSEEGSIKKRGHTDKSRRTIGLLPRDSPRQQRRSCPRNFMLPVKSPNHNGIYLPAACSLQQLLAPLPLLGAGADLRNLDHDLPTPTLDVLAHRGELHRQRLLVVCGDPRVNPRPHFLLHPTTPLPDPGQKPSPNTDPKTAYLRDSIPPQTVWPKTLVIGQDDGVLREASYRPKVSSMAPYSPFARSCRLHVEGAAALLGSL